MTNDAWNTRWARELNERDVRQMREKGPGGVYHVTPPPCVPPVAFWAIAAAIALIAGMAIGYAVYFAAEVIFE